MHSSFDCGTIVFLSDIVDIWKIWRKNKCLVDWLEIWKTKAFEFGRRKFDRKCAVTIQTCWLASKKRKKTKLYDVEFADISSRFYVVWLLLLLFYFVSIQSTRWRPSDRVVFDRFRQHLLLFARYFFYKVRPDTLSRSIDAIEGTDRPVNDGNAGRLLLASVV